MTSPETSQQPDALLQAILNLSKFHRDHEKFYSSAPREQAVVLQRHARTLLALADRWSTVQRSERPVLSPYEAAEDLNAPDRSSSMVCCSLRAKAVRLRSRA